MIFSLVFIIVIIILVLLTWSWTYSVIIPFLTSKEDVKQTIKIILILSLVACLGSIFLKLYNKEPAFLQQGLDQLHSDEFIKKQIGNFSSYSIIDDNLPKHPKKIAVFHIELIGDSLTLYLTCTMQNTDKSWKLTDMHKDSIGKVQ